jgi:HAD superfamily hydrolase (TIGR01509 family)
MTVSALIFGGIGTLVETSELQREAFNDAFSLSGLPFSWSKTEYNRTLTISGGIKRLSHVVLQDGAALTADQMTKIHADKTARFAELLRDRHLPLRDGVSTLLQQASSRGVKLAWATTTSKANIQAITEATAGALRPDMFAFIGNDTLVQRQKPDPEIYLTTLLHLGLKPDQVMAVEDSPTGVASATAAGLATIAFPGAAHLSQNFSTAAMTVNDVSNLLHVMA